MKLTKAIKKDLEMLNDPNISEIERKILTTLKRLVIGETSVISHEEMKKEIKEMLKKHSETRRIVNQNVFLLGSTKNESRTSNNEK